MTRTMFWRSLLILPVFAVWLAASGAALADPKHPHMHMALYELKAARTELKEAAHDFGGHREAALKATDAAIAQIEVALTAAGDKYKDVTVEKDVYKEYKHHPHIHRAIRVLKETRMELKEAKHDFGGHREQALKDVNGAIEQLELALKSANAK